MLRRAFLLSAIGAAAAATPAKAQFSGLLGGGGAEGGDLLGGGLGGGGDAFRQMELMGGQFTLTASQIALERSRRADVRDFAQLEINEQTAVAAALGTTPGSVSLRQDHAAIIDQLGRLDGSAFDRLYLRAQTSGHQELLTLNANYAQTGTDTRDRALAVVAVPSIQTHLEILGRLQHARRA